MTEPLDLAAIAARADNATDGPWIAVTHNRRKDGIALVGALAKRGTGEAIAVLAGASGNRHNDAEFVAAARADVPALVAEMRRLREQLEASLAIAARWGHEPAGDHKTWVIDQMVRALTACPITTEPIIDGHGRKHHDADGNVIEGDVVGKSNAYLAFVARFNDADGGPESGVWNTGVTP